jgi:hypothetical protein
MSAEMFNRNAIGVRDNERQTFVSTHADGVGVKQVNSALLIL